MTLHARPVLDQLRDLFGFDLALQDIYLIVNMAFLAATTGTCKGSTYYRRR